MKLGFICLNLPGHLNQMTALARHLQARNHEVVFLYSSGASGLPFVPGSERDEVNENRPAGSKLQGEEAVDFSLRVLLSQTETILKSLPAIVQANQIDALVIDTVQFYAELGALQLGLPYIHVSAAVYFDYSGYTPLSIYDWPHQTTPEALARNREGVTNFVKRLESVNQGVRSYTESMAQGVPQIAVPVAYDQPGVAARIANKQTGVVTSLDKLTAKHLSKLLNEVLSNPTYRNNARKLQKAIAKANGLSVAADLIDEALGATEPAAIETDGDGWKAWDDKAAGLLFLSESGAIQSNGSSSEP